MKLNRLITLGVALAAACAVAAPLTVLAQASEHPANIRVTIELGRLEGQQKTSASSYEFLACPGSERAELDVNVRMPIPTTVSNTPEDKEKQVVSVASYTYQNIGMSAKVKATPTENGRIHVAGDLQASFLRDQDAKKEPTKPPTVGSLSQSLNVDLREGKPLRVSAVDVPGMGMVYIELKAEALN